MLLTAQVSNMFLLTNPKSWYIGTMKTKSILIALLGIIFMTQAACSSTPGEKDNIKFYAGSGNGKISHPIFLCELDPVNQAITVLDSFPAKGGAGYLDLSPDQSILYATSGLSVSDEKKFNSVASFRVNPEDYSLELINHQSSQGRGNCHVQSSPDGKYVFAANYSSGDATALPVDESGKLLAATSVVKGEGTGPNAQRQEGPHAHMVMMDPEGKFLLVPDLGTDKIMNYAFDGESGSLSPNPAQPFLEMEPGSGPRHLTFHPEKNLVYILGEMSATVTACKFDPESGVLSKINSGSIVEEDFSGKRQSAAIRVHPNGNFVYASNRDDVSNLAVFEVGDKGEIKQIQLVDSVPYWPRDFNITPDGKYILVAGARANEIALYQVDVQTGLLSETEASITLPGITCILLAN